MSRVRSVDTDSAKHRRVSSYTAVRMPALRGIGKARPSGGNAPARCNFTGSVVLQLEDSGCFKVSGVVKAQRLLELSKSVIVTTACRLTCYDVNLRSVNLWSRQAVLRSLNKYAARHRHVHSKHQTHCCSAINRSSAECLVWLSQAATEA